MWKKAAVYNSGLWVERYGNAGLSTDGKKCFLTDIDEDTCLVFDVNTGNTLWRDDYESLDSLLLKPGESHLHLTYSQVEGDYRLFGLGYNHPILEYPSLNLFIQLSLDTEELILTDTKKRKEVQRLKYEAFSGDWAFATFSDDGSTIAVLEPYYVTFFRIGKEMT